MAKPVDDLKTAEAKQEEVIQYQILDGQIESVNKSTISAQTTGVISKLKYDVGDYVKKGDEIARISSQNQKAGMLEAKASVGKASANVSQAAATVSQAQASLKESQASYAEARSAFDQIKSIYQKRLIAKSQYDSAEAAMKSAAARVDAAKANLTATKAAYNSTKSGLNAAKAGLTKAGEQLGYTQLLAPYSGIVTERHVELGEVVAAGKPIMTGISLSEMRAIATIPQRIILAVRKHKSARVYVDGDNIGIPAKSLTIFPYADPSTNGFKVRAALDSGIKGLFPGVFVKVGFEIGKSTRLVVPQSAIASRGEVTAVLWCPNEWFSRVP